MLRRLTLTFDPGAACDAPWLTQSGARTCLGSFDPSESMYSGQDISQMIH